MKWIWTRQFQDGANSTNVICFKYLKTAKGELKQLTNNKILTLSIIFLLTLTAVYVSAASMAPVKAAPGDGQWITNYTIKDGNTGSFIYSNDLTNGRTDGNLLITNNQELEVTVTIDVATNNPSSSLTLSTDMQHSSNKDVYWEHSTSDGYDLGSYNPNSGSFSFAQNQGTLTITCFGVAVGETETDLGNDIILHKAVPISLISLTDPGGAVLDEIRPDITDASINDFNTKLKTAEKNLASSGSDPAYASLARNVIDSAKEAADAGLTDTAVQMLNSINNSNAASSQIMSVLFIPLVAIFAALMALFAFMFFRNRGKVSYYQMVVEDQIKDLEGLTLRAQKIDRTMAASLDSVKDRLKRLVGM